MQCATRWRLSSTYPFEQLLLGQGTCVLLLLQGARIQQVVHEAGVALAVAPDARRGLQQLKCRSSSTSARLLVQEGSDRMDNVHCTGMHGSSYCSTRQCSTASLAAHVEVFEARGMGTMQLMTICHQIKQTAGSSMLSDRVAAAAAAVPPACCARGSRECRTAPAALLPPG